MSFILKYVCPYCSQPQVNSKCVSESEGKIEDVEYRDEPDEGDLTVCSGCGEWGRLIKNGEAEWKVEKLTAQQVLDLPESTIILMHRARQYVQASKGSVN